MRRLLCVAITLAVLHGVCAAEGIHWTQADDMVPQGYYYAVAAGDLDGDLDQDLTIPGSCQYWNVGTPQEPVWELDVNQFPGIPFCRDPMGALGDIDDDGDLDLLLECYYSPCLRLYRNTGTPPDDPSWEYDPILEWLDWTGQKDPSLADIDADGDLDIFVCTGHGPIWHILNEGTLSSPDWVLNSTVEGVQTGLGAAFGDVDGDGDLDLVGFAADYSVKCWENIGTPQSYQFNMNPDMTTSIVVDPQEYPWDIELVDLDSDGDQDLLVATLTDHNYFFLNDGPVTSVEQLSWGTIKALYR